MGQPDETAEKSDTFAGHEVPSEAEPEQSGGDGEQPAESTQDEADTAEAGA